LLLFYVSGTGYARCMSSACVTLDRLAEPVARLFTLDVARALTQLRADPDLQARMDELAEKSNEGQLTPAEREEYETSVHFADFIAILQAKARKRLRELESA
jgi:hypothetical protein